MKYPNHNTFLTSAVERSKKFHVIKYKTVLGRLTSLDNTSFFKNSNQNYLSFLSTLKSADIISYGTDFFWSIIHRLNAALDKKNIEEIETSYVYFLLNSFDSFYSILPNDSEVQFKNINNGKVILPKLNVSLDCFSSSMTSIRKINTHLLEYKLYKYGSLENCNYTISLIDVPSWFMLRKEWVCDRIAIIYQRHESIFEAHYIQDCCEDAYLGHLLKNKIEEAFEKIKFTNLDLYQKLVSSIDYIIPYGNDIEKRYPNFAIATLKRTIFLSIDLLVEPVILVAECIIHEFSHCELHCVQDTVLLTNIENNIYEYYSPWRKDARPLLGLIHAIFISHEIVSFYLHYIENPCGNIEETLLVKEKVHIIICQIFIASKQIKQHQLTDFTIELIDSINKSTQSIADKLSISISNLPNALISHMEYWKLNNPNLNIVE